MVAGVAAGWLAGGRAGTVRSRGRVSQSLPPWHAITSAGALRPLCGARGGAGGAPRLAVPGGAPEAVPGGCDGCGRLEGAIQCRRCCAGAPPSHSTHGLHFLPQKPVPRCSSLPPIPQKHLQQGTKAALGALFELEARAGRPGSMVAARPVMLVDRRPAWLESSAQLSLALGPDPCHTPQPLLAQGVDEATTRLLYNAGVRCCGLGGRAGWREGG